MLRTLTVFVLSLAVFVLNADGNLYFGDVSAEAGGRFLSGGWFDKAVVPVFRDDKEAWDGKYSIRLEYDLEARKKPEYDPAMNWITTLASIRPSPVLEENTPYTLSFYAKADRENYPVGIGMVVATVPHRKRGASSTITLGKEWKRYTLTWKPQYPKQGRSGYTFYFKFENSPSGKIWFDAVQLEKGSRATEFRHPAPASIGVDVNAQPDTWNTFFFGERVEAQVNVVKHRGFSGEMILRAADWQGREVFRTIRKVDGTQSFKFPLPSQRYGWFKLTAELRSGGKLLAADELNYSVIHRPVEIKNGIEPFCGMISLSMHHEKQFAFLRRLGCRRHQTALRLGQLDTGNGIDWRQVEWNLRMAKKYGMKNKVTFSPWGVPDRYLDPQDLAEFSKMKNRGQFLVMERKYHDTFWRNYIGKFTRKYGSLADEFEIGGEDNGRLGKNMYYIRKYPQFCRGGWLAGGKPFDDLCNMVRVGAEEIRKHKPDAKIGAIRHAAVCCEVTEDPFTEAMLRKVGQYIDILPVDIYTLHSFNLGPAYPTHIGNPAERKQNFDHLMKVLKQTGTCRRIFISESGLFPYVFDPGDGKYRQQQCTVFAQDYLAARAAGYYAYDYFTGFRGVNIQLYAEGILNVHQLQSYAAAYTSIAQIVENAVGTDWIRPDNETVITFFRKPDGSGAAGIWAEPGYFLQLPEGSSKELKIMDVMGNPLPGGDRLALSGVPLLMTCPSAEKLHDILKRAYSSQPAFCKVFFRRISHRLGQLKLVNPSNRKDIALHTEVRNGNGFYQDEIPVPAGGSNTFRFPVEPAEPVKVMLHPENHPEQKMTAEFSVLRLTSIAGGGKPVRVIGRIRDRSGILPNEPWTPWTGPDDFSAEARASWNREALHIEVLVRDDLHFNNKKTNPWNGDSVQLAVDPQNNGTLRKLKHKSFQAEPGDHELIVALHGDGTVSRQVCAGAAGLGSPQYSTVVRNEADKTTRYRIELPWKILGVTPAKGKVIGMSMVIFDDDGGTGMQYYGSFGGGIINGKDAALYERFILE